ncbi:MULTISPECIES: tetratricopeptide repeat protein [unclassified Pseudomonas]|uniref:tetratricopeptide repeat protein n=1 Tax=unclassified Pseudomonas TaxID=196821 RepID=UPI00159FA681|nr:MULTISPECIES: tetratricopeptide repeat protein [unclassified Pseudomonas]NWC93042.1 tetratricopeptide repeat protein [Pseudomonas sp. IPO3779]NWD19460.1 tetratricopeptide repeat protein [Pseudomonas sp. IPO3778]
MGKNIMIETLATISALTKAGDFQAAYALAVPLAKQHPDDVTVQITTAYACDRLGYEQEALVYYQGAWKLGVPQEEQFEFLLGFSSTLRNVGRAEESLEWLRQARKSHPHSAVLAAFTALALHAAGQNDLALATMLDCALKTADGNGLAPYTRALTHYRDELAATVDRPCSRGEFDG